MKKSLKIIIFIVIIFIIYVMWKKSSENMITINNDTKLNCKWTDINNITYNKTSLPCTKCNICQISDKITYRNNNCNSNEINMGTTYINEKSCSL